MTKKEKLYNVAIQLIENDGTSADVDEMFVVQIDLTVFTELKRIDKHMSSCLTCKVPTHEHLMEDLFWRKPLNVNKHGPIQLDGLYILYYTY